MEVEKTGGVLFRIDRFDGIETSDTCCFCFGNTNLRDITSTYYHDGKPEVYNQMIHDCFSIKLLKDQHKENKGSYMICELCVSRLREAYFFRMIVEIARAAIQQKESIKLESNLEDFDSLSNSPYTYNIQILCDPPENASGNNNGHERITDISSKTASWVKPESWSKPTQKVVSSNSEEEEEEEDDVPLNKIKKMFVRKTITKPKMKRKVIKIKKETTSPDTKKKASDGPKNLDSSYIGEHRCHVCSETFPLRSGLVKHMASHSQAHICDICARCFTSKSNLHSHLTRHRQRRDLVSCQICKKTYRGTMNLKKHLRIHKAPNEIYKCPHCPERFSNYYRRMQHLVDFHDDEAKKYKCKHCPKRYCQATTLTRHIKVVHLQERRYSCDSCGMNFYDRSALKGHMLKHTGIKRFRCEICSKAYARRFTLNEHMKIHDNVKKFVCPICTRPFTQKCTLKNHMKVHKKDQMEIQYSEDM